MSRLMKLRLQRDALAKQIDGVFLGKIDVISPHRNAFDIYRSGLIHIACFGQEVGYQYDTIINAMGYISDRFDLLVKVQRYARLCLLVTRAEWKHVKSKPSWYYANYDWLKRNTARHYLWQVYIDNNPTLDGEA